MKILVAGGTGFIGTALIHSLSNNHDITVLSRSSKHVVDVFGQKVKTCSWDELASLDAHLYDTVINLAGYNIAASRWTEKTKRLIIDSRVNTNAMLINWLINAQAKPHYYCANAVGIYGAQANGSPDVLNEDSPINVDHPTDFLNEVGVLWQQSLQPAIDYGLPVTITRFGVVLKRGEGMLKKLVPAYKLGLGSVIGNGEQVLSWIHIDDVVRGYHFLMKNPDLVGAFNFTSPNPVSQAVFAKSLAKAMHRPLLLKTPFFVIRLLFGEMGEYLINKGQRVVPKRLPEAGFKFKYLTIEEALQHEFKVE